MSDLRKAAQMALEALDSDHPDIQLRAAITLRAALAQPEQEPVAWMQDTTAGLYVEPQQDRYHTVPLYTAPPQRKPLTEEQCDSIEHKAYLSTISKGKPMGDYAKKIMRAIEKAHGIGGDV